MGKFGYTAGQVRVDPNAREEVLDDIARFKDLSEQSLDFLVETAGEMQVIAAKNGLQMASPLSGLLTEMAAITHYVRKLVEEFPDDVVVRAYGTGVSSGLALLANRILDEAMLSTGHTGEDDCPACKEHESHIEGSHS